MLKNKNILIFTVLFGLFYSAFNNLSLIEKEFQNNGSEIGNNYNNNDSSNDDNEESDSDDENDNLYNHFNILFIDFDLGSKDFFKKNCFYTFCFKEIKIKPPKI